MRTVIDRHGNVQRVPAAAAARAAAQHAAPRHHGAAAAPRAATAHITRRLLATALVVLGAAWLLAQRRGAADHAWLLTPTLARSREPHAHAALIAADEAFPHTYSRIQPRKDAAPSGAQLALARALLGSMPHKEVAQLVGGSTLQHVAHGEALGDAFNFQKGGYTRCAVAAYATVTYFCGAAAAAHAYTHAESLRGAGALRAAIAAVRRVDARAQGVFHVTVNDDADETFGHVFALHLLPDDGTTQPYMSYINAYRLSQYLRRTPPLDAAQLDAFLNALATLEAEGKGGGGGAGGGSNGAFSVAAHAAYAAAFGVRLDEKFASGRVVTRAELLCIVPPRNANGVADVRDARHVHAVAALLPHALAALSLQ
jgi:hypothetical protein